MLLLRAVFVVVFVVVSVTVFVIAFVTVFAAESAPIFANCCRLRPLGTLTTPSALGKASSLSFRLLASTSSRKFSSDPRSECSFCVGPGNEGAVSTGCGVGKLFTVCLDSSRCCSSIGGSRCVSSSRRLSLALVRAKGL